jgi:hypothetical protein
MFHRDQRHTGAAPQQTVVHLANPAGAPVFTTGDPITLVVDATAAVAPILEVRFYAGTNWLGSATNSPYVLAWTNALPGDIALTDAATDFSGSSGTSAPVFITVVAPSTNFPVQLLAQGAGSFTLVPQAGAYAPGTPVTVTARAGRYYAFVQWSDGDTNNPRTIVVGTSNTFTAVFTNLVPLETRVLRQWDQSYGGPGVNSLSAILPTADGGFLLGCSSGAGSGNNKTSGNFGGSDYWVVKVDGSGNPLWDLVYGGTNDDTLTAIQPTSDGGYLLGGSSASGVSGNKTTLNFGGLDFWIVKIDGNGVKQWDKVYGGVADDVLAAMAPTGDGGFLLGGTTQSDISGNKTTPIYGGQDFWVIKN